jgi:hypothetical protein
MVSALSDWPARPGPACVVSVVDTDSREGRGLTTTSLQLVMKRGPRRNVPPTGQRWPSAQPWGL